MREKNPRRLRFGTVSLDVALPLASFAMLLSVTGFLRPLLGTENLIVVAFSLTSLAGLIIFIPIYAVVKMIRYRYVPAWTLQERQLSEDMNILVGTFWLFNGLLSLLAIFARMRAEMEPVLTFGHVFNTIVPILIGATYLFAPVRDRLEERKNLNGIDQQRW